MSSDEEESRKNKTAANKATLSANPTTTFRLPSDFEQDPDRYELWTLRFPADVSLQDLNGVQIQLEKDEHVQIESNSKNYQLTWGQRVENESMRLLVAKSQLQKDEDEDSHSSDSDSDEVDNDNHNESFLYPITQSFSRHINIVESPATLDERALAPTLEQAPPPVDVLRRAYTPVAQRTNLVRRWQMPGARVTKAEPDPLLEKKPPPKRKLSEVDVPDEPVKARHREKVVHEKVEENIKDVTESAKKAAKRAKKEAKEARKKERDSKRAAKAAKKQKKEEKKRRSKA